MKNKIRACRINIWEIIKVKANLVINVKIIDELMWETERDREKCEWVGKNYNWREKKKSN